MADINQPVRLDLRAKDNASREIRAVGQAAERAERHTGRLEKTLARLGNVALGVFSVALLKKVVQYSESVAKAAGDSSALGQTWAEMETAARGLKSAFDEAFGNLLQVILPELEQSFRGLELLIREVGGAVGLVGKQTANEGQVLTAVLDDLLARQKVMLAAIRAAQSGASGGLQEAGAPGLTGILNLLNAPSKEAQDRLDRMLVEYQQLVLEIDAAQKLLAEFNKQQEIAAEQAKAVAFNVPKGFEFIPEPVREGPPIGKFESEPEFRVPDSFQFIPDEEPFGPAADFQQINENLRDMQPITDRLAQSWETLRDRVFNFKDAAGDAVLAVGQSLENNLSNALESIITGTQDAGDAFKDFARGIVADLASIGARLLSIFILESLTGIKLSGGGGGFAMHGGVFGGGGRGSPLRLHQMMSGGVARGPSAVIYREGSRDEAFVPLDDARSIPVSLRGGSGASVVHNYYIDATDLDSFRRLLVSSGDTLLGIQRHGLSHIPAHREATRKAVA